MAATAILDAAGFTASAMAGAIRSLYRVTGRLDEFISDHLKQMQESDDSTIAASGRVLASTWTGLKFGYAAPIVVITVGQLLLGNPLTAVVSGVSMAFSPVAMTCAAVGAVWMGWSALNESERTKLIGIASAGLAFGAEVIVQIAQFAADAAKRIFERMQSGALRELVASEASAFGKSISQISGRFVDKLTDFLPQKPSTPQGGDEALEEVLATMNREELSSLLQKTLGCSDRVELLNDSGLRLRVAEGMGDAAAYSWPWAKRPTYPEVVALVAKQLKLPSPSTRDVREVERVILFKLVEVSLEELSEAQKTELASSVEGQLRERGVAGKVTFEEIAKFVKTGAVDFGGTLGGLVFAAPGMYGVIGLNFLQFAVLKGIILTGGYMAGGSALLGFGAGGLMLAVAGWAGPVGAGLAVLYGAYKSAGPAYRKLVPAVCLIAAKRLEITPADQPNPAIPR